MATEQQRALYKMHAHQDRNPYEQTAWFQELEREANQNRSAAMRGEIPQIPLASDSSAASDPWGGTPPPAWASMVDPATGQLSSQYTLQAPSSVAADQYTAAQLTGNYGVTGPDKVQYGSVFDTAKSLYDPIQGNEASMDAYRQRATQTGPSAWASMQEDLQRLGEQDTLQKTASANQGAMSNAMSALALRGGLTGGAAQRLARTMGQQSALSQQDIRRQGMADRLGLSIADEATKSDFLKGLPAAEIAWLQPQLQKAAALTSVKTDDTNRAFDANKFDIGNTMRTNEFNAGQLLSRDQYNTSALNDASKFNIGNKFAADQFNADALFKTNQFNTSNLMNEVNAGRNAELDQWKTKMGVIGADKSATAMANSGKK